LSAEHVANNNNNNNKKGVSFESNKNEIKLEGKNKNQCLIAKKKKKKRCSGTLFHRLIFTAPWKQPLTTGSKLMGRGRQAETSWRCG